MIQLQVHLIAGYGVLLLNRQPHSRIETSVNSARFQEAELAQAVCARSDSLELSLLLRTEMIECSLMKCMLIEASIASVAAAVKD